MPILASRIVSPEEFDRAEAEYFREETLEDMSESATSFRQRRFTLAALDKLKALHYPKLEIFNELLLLFARGERIDRVVPDNFVMLEPPSQNFDSSFRVSETNRPFWVLEYVSPSTQNKDYVESYEKYEDLGIPYCTMFEPPVQKLTMFRHDGHCYQPLQADQESRYLIPELELKVGLKDGWMRFWFREELLPSPLEETLELEAASLKLAEQDHTIAEQDHTIAEQDHVIAELMAESARIQAESRERNRRRVTKLATNAGRTDIVSQAQDADADQLEQWLDELTG